MNENVKKSGLIALIVIAVLAVGIMFYNNSKNETMDVVKTINAPPGYKSEKEKALEAQAQGAAPAPSGKEEADLGSVGAAGSN